MKKFAIVALMALGTHLVQAQTDTEDAEVESLVKDQCLYCRNEDRKAGFLVSYSYCDQQEVCLKDAWNYIKRECMTGWKRGKNLSLAACNPEEVTCPEFESSPEKYQRYYNDTWSLAAGSKCVVRVDASNGVARVIFDNTLYLGIELDAQIEEVITIRKGTVQDITIYNAAESGPITFGISFSGASALVSSAAALAALSLLSF